MAICAAHSRAATRGIRCGWTTPLLRPVVPDVSMIATGSRGPTRGSSTAGSPAARRSFQVRTVTPGGVRRWRSPSSRTTVSRVCGTSGRSATSSSRAASVTSTRTPVLRSAWSRKEPL
ncbi:predicted protein [Streptomyces iranensis]|uniref:Uncharacterized protein n=1 Tax=Streptomyces iranensis TaxID=576784 RepID=A0A061A4L0_9ACTN|nr:predicted protein [Streptomyces iranensis]